MSRFNPAQNVALAMVLFGLCTFSSIQGQTGNAQTSVSKTPFQHAPQPIEVSNQGFRNYRTDSKSVGPGNYLSELIAPSNLPNLLLVAVGTGAIVLSWKTVRSTRDAANAALINAQAVINAERARILIKAVQENGPGNEVNFRVMAINYGRVPASRLEISKTTVVNKTLEELVSKEPVYETGDNTHEWLAPMGELPIYKFITHEHQVALITDNAKACSQDGARMTFIYGQVEYLDGISPEVRHSRYCFFYDWIFVDGDGKMTPIESRKYVECT